jgi:hypothetical protein
MITNPLPAIPLPVASGRTTFVDAGQRPPTRCPPSRFPSPVGEQLLWTPANAHQPAARDIPLPVASRYSRYHYFLKQRLQKLKKLF